MKTAVAVSFYGHYQNQREKCMNRIETYTFLLFAGFVA